ncbi:MAG: TonB-dependent receptor [Chitinophagales bacterium]
MKTWWQFLSIAWLLHGLLVPTFGQTLTQTIRGTVLDKENKTTLIGATVLLVDSTNQVGTVTDVDGHFKLENIPIGRQTLRISYLGYEARTLSNVLLNVGKELVLNIELEENYTELDEFVVTPASQQGGALNEMATVSATMFSVEETQRYAAAAYDPARMVQAYAGVVLDGEDIDNEIVVRGNSPSGVLWRLEGIDIPNPNHFSNPGSSGGAISMLSSSTLTNSDFYTGAFPAEYGNALAGAFDLKFRNGNNQKKEYALMFGPLGLEVAAEGPFSENSRASYLVNYRYSTLGLMGTLMPNLKGRVPAYQDISFKVNVPTQKAGTFSLFGLGGVNNIGREPEPDTTLWENKFDGIAEIEKQRLGILGLSHFYPLTPQSYLKTVIATTADRYFEEVGQLDPLKDYQKKFFFASLLKNRTIRGHALYHHKFDVKHALRVGVLFANMNYDLQTDARDRETDIWTRHFDSEGTTNRFQTYAQWKFRFHENLTFHTGLHYTYLVLNESQSLDPRATLQWKMVDNKTLSFAIGKHSQQQHISTYLVEKTNQAGQLIRPNTNLAFSQAIHYVLAYDHTLNKNWRLKAEAYYQHLYDVPVEAGSTSVNSLLNSSRIWDVFSIDKLNNEGTGVNYGVDVTLNKFFANRYYVLLTSSLYNSKFRPADGELYNTRYNGNYLVNALSGKEWEIGKNKLFGLNGKLMWHGGNRYTDYDLAQSIEMGQEVLLEDELFEARYPDYFRFDIGFKLSFNKNTTTHTILVDMQNVSNHQNVFERFYSEADEKIITLYQTGIFPYFNYRITF